MNNITLTATMPNYNYANFVGEAIEGILHQSLQPDEVIIIDDCSTDNSYDVISRYRNIKNFNIMRHEKNMGMLHSVNELIDLANGEYFVSVGSDDYWLSHYLESSMGQLKKHPQAGLCCSNPRFLFSESGTSADHFFQWSEQPRYFPPDDFASLIENGWYPEGHTCVYHKVALVEAGKYRAELGHHGDCFYNLVIGFRHGICYVPDVMSVRRMHSNAFTATTQKDTDNQIIANYLDLLTSEQYSDIYHYFVKSSATSVFFKDNIAKVLLSDKRYWDVKYLMLGLQSFWQYFSNITVQRESKYNRSWQYEQAMRLREYVNAGNNALSNDNPNEALRIFTELLNVAPQEPAVYAGLSSTFMSTRNYGEAQKVIDLAFERNISDVSLWRNLGKLRTVTSDHGGAQQAFFQVLQAMPDDVEALTALGGSFMAQGKKGEAMSLYKYALEKHAMNPQIWLCAAKVAIAMYDKGYAKHALEKTLELWPENAEAQRLYSFITG